MNPLPVEFHPEAIEEARAAREWYSQRSTKAAEHFRDEMDHAIEQVANAPDRWPLYLHGTRHYLFRRFPYVLVYRHTTDVVEVIAVPHAKRRPGYWKDRLSNGQ